MPHICGVLTLYNPPGASLANVDTYISYIDTLLVIDNTPGGSGDFLRELQERHSKVMVLSGGSNLGIARALNLALDEAWSKGADWLLTMDQDSRFGEPQAARFFESVGAVDTGRVAILSPMHHRCEADHSTCHFEEKTIVWTSGNLLNLELARRIGHFDERLFIDSVDHDYCFRAHLAGYQVLQSTNCHLDHAIGETVDRQLLWGLITKKIEVHSPKRMYFIIRNALYMSDWYGREFSRFMRRLRKQVRKEIVRAFLFCDSRAAYAKYSFRAVMDYRNKVYGNAVNL